MSQKIHTLSCFVLSRGKGEEGRGKGEEGGGNRTLRVASVTRNAEPRAAALCASPQRVDKPARRAVSQVGREFGARGGGRGTRAEGSGRSASPVRQRSKSRVRPLWAARV